MLKVGSRLYGIVISSRARMSTRIQRAEMDSLIQVLHGARCKVDLGGAQIERHVASIAFVHLLMVTFLTLILIEGL